MSSPEVLPTETTQTMDDVVLQLLSLEPSNNDATTYTSPLFRAKGPYSGLFECLVCKDPNNSVETVWLTYQAKQEHCKDSLHLIKLERAKKLRQRACGKLCCAQLLSQKMDTVGAPVSLRADLARYLFNPTLAGPSDSTLVRKMKAQLDQIERNEPTTLLELAVWKAACLISDSAPKDHYGLRNWWNHGWKAGKASCRRHALIEVVLSNVMPFL